MKRVVAAILGVVVLLSFSVASAGTAWAGPLASINATTTTAPSAATCTKLPATTPAPDATPEVRPRRPAPTSPTDADLPPSSLEVALPDARGPPGAGCVETAGSIAAGGTARSSSVEAFLEATAGRRTQFWNNGAPRGYVSGDRGILRAKLEAARAGDAAAAAELRAAKLLRAEGRRVHFVDDLAASRAQAGVTHDVFIDRVVAGDFKRISGLGHAAKDLAKGVRQVGPGGQVIVIRPGGAPQPLGAYSDFVSNFRPRQPGVSFRVVDEGSLPLLYFQR